MEQLSLFDLEGQINYNHIDFAGVRLMLHKYVYSNPDNINDLLNIISQHIDLLNIEYNPNDHCIIMKIKKTSLKKDSNFEHSTMYYQPIFNNIFYNFLMQKYHLFQNTFESNTCLPPFQKWCSNMPLYIYNITCLSDNMIYIYL